MPLTYNIFLLESSKNSVFVISFILTSLWVEGGSLFIISIVQKEKLKAKVTCFNATNWASVTAGTLFKILTVECSIKWI